MWIFFRSRRHAGCDCTDGIATVYDGGEKVAVPSTVHCDHLIQAKESASSDLAQQWS